MSSDIRLNWTWRPAETPSAPQAAVACGNATRHLLDRLAAHVHDNAPAALFATANADMLVVIGPEQDLPWAPGVAYAAPSLEDSSLWLPTLQRPDAPCDLLARALIRRHGRSPLLLWPAPAAVMPLDRQLPVSSTLLERIATLWQPRPLSMP